VIALIKNANRIHLLILNFWEITGLWKGKKNKFIARKDNCGTKTPRRDAVPNYLYATAKCTLGLPKSEGDTIKNVFVSFPSRQTF